MTDELDTQALQNHASDTTSLPVPTDQKHNPYKTLFFIMLGLFIALTIASGAYYLGTTAQTDQMKVGGEIKEIAPPSTQPMTIPALEEQKPIYSSDWKTYSSTRRAYSFKYLPEPTWFSYFYDEDNPQVAYGAHIITNYDTVGVENYMDHGMVDWKSFIQDKPVIKIQIGVAELNTTQEAFKETLLAQENKLVEPEVAIAQVEIGGLTTEVYQYYGSFKNDDMQVFTFLAFPNDKQVVTVGVNFNNITQATDVTTTEEWQNIDLLLKSFEFTE